MLNYKDEIKELILKLKIKPDAKMANSTHKCTTGSSCSIGLSQLREHLPRGLKPQAFAGTMIHGLHRGEDLLLRHLV